LRIQSFQLVHAERFWNGVHQGLYAVRAIILLLVYVLYAHYVGYLYPWTRPLARRGESLLFEPLRTILGSIVAAIPNLAFIAILILVPAAMVLVFSQSERATRQWLGAGFDTDRDLLEMTTTGNLMDNKVGAYLKSLQNNFPGEVVADMLCMLRIHAELSVKAKGIMLMREAGFDVPPEPGVPEAFQELQYLEKSIGKTGKLALYPFMHMTDRELWQLHMLRQAH